MPIDTGATIEFQTFLIRYDSMWLEEVDVVVLVEVDVPVVAESKSKIIGFGL